MDDWGSVDEVSLSLSLKRLHEGAWRGIFFAGDPGRYVKVSRCRHLSLLGPLCRRGEPGMWWGSYIEDFDR
jgi:hypothetical protein